MDKEPLGEIVGTGQCYRVQSSIRIKAKIEEVWETATQSEKVGWWFALGVIEGEGGRIALNYADGEFGMAAALQAAIPDDEARVQQLAIEFRTQHER